MKSPVLCVRRLVVGRLGRNDSGTRNPTRWVMSKSDAVYKQQELHRPMRKVRLLFNQSSTKNRKTQLHRPMRKVFNESSTKNRKTLHQTFKASSYETSGQSSKINFSTTCFLPSSYRAAPLLRSSSPRPPFKISQSWCMASPFCAERRDDVALHEFPPSRLDYMQIFFWSFLLTCYIWKLGAASEGAS